MRLFFLLLFFPGLSVSVHAQKYVIEKGYVGFFSSAALEDIKAENSKVTSIYNTATGDIVFSVPIVEFMFEKSLMQEHFNEKYMESDKYPKALFQGKVQSFDTSMAGVQTVRATGKLTIHGVTNNIDVPGTLELRDGKLYMLSKFIVRLEDYKVKIPKMMWQNIAEQVEVTVSFEYKAQ